MGDSAVTNNMINMKKILFYMMLVLSSCLLGCSDDDDKLSTNDDDKLSTNDIVGTWHATVGGGKASISLTFNSNKTGTLNYCWDNVIYHVVEYIFTYQISGNTIKTQGTYIDSDSDGDTEGSMDFTYSNGKLTGGRWATDNGYTR